MTARLPALPDRLPPLTDEHVTIVPAGFILARAHDVGGRHSREFNEPRHFGPLLDRGRFDHHPAGAPRDHEPDHGVIYAACADPTIAHHARVRDGGGSLPGNVIDVVLAELVQSDKVLLLGSGLTLTLFQAAAPLRLLDVRSSWGLATRVGTHLSTSAHREAQPWARAIRRDYPQLHGVLYAPATGGRAVAVALNESAAPRLVDAPVMLSRRFSDPALSGVINSAAERLQITITT